MNPKVNVIVITRAPILSNPAIQKGIRNKVEAEAWGAKNGHTTVWLWQAREMVYADRLKTNVHAQAKQVERKSEALVSSAENGESLLEYAVIILLVLLILFALGGLLGWPW